MGPAKRRFIPVGLAILGVTVWLAWSPVLLWYAKNAAAKHIQDAEALNQVLASEVKRIPSGVSGGERVASDIDGYRFSFPAPEYQKLPGRHVDFDSEKLKVRCLGVLSLTGEFAKIATDDSPASQYFSKTDPFQILVDVFNARPKDIKRQETFDNLNRHMALLLIKTILTPIGSDKHWERIDTGKREGIIAGDTSMPSIIVTLYLPESREFADVVISPRENANMDDVYSAIGELDIQQILER